MHGLGGLWCVLLHERWRGPTFLARLRPLSCVHGTHTAEQRSSWCDATGACLARSHCWVGHECRLPLHLAVLQAQPVGASVAGALLPGVVPSARPAARCTLPLRQLPPAAAALRPGAGLPAGVATCTAAKADGDAVTIVAAGAGCVRRVQPVL